MSGSAVITEQVSKKFSTSLRQMMAYGAFDMASAVLGHAPESNRLRPGEFWAVEDVSFELKRGESMGIIGPNGSGKTTLLRMLNGIFMPDKGRIEVDGRVGGLIHVGAGFHPMLTGRENIYVNGAILGMTTRQIDEKFDAIVDFADIGSFLDAPVKQYSSGMYVRLGFAVAVHSDPDILLIDEVLAVGDREFSLKCYARMKEICSGGATVILVSHNEYVIRERTEKALYLKNGRARAFGPSEDMISLYIKDGLEEKARRMATSAEHGKEWVAKKVEILGVRLLDPSGREIDGVLSGDPLKVEFSYRLTSPLSEPFLSLNFYNDSGLVYSANSAYEEARFSLKPGEGKIVLTFPRLDLPSETYYLSAIAGEGKDCQPLDLMHFFRTFVVSRAKNARGLLRLPCEWRQEA